MCNIDEPPTKRTKIDCQYHGEGKSIDLPPELWGHALDYLPFSDVIQCWGVSKQLQEAMNFAGSN
jgi:hypothetical protein